MQYYTNATDADERKVTDQMIKKYGAKKVRGAGLTKRKMTKKEIEELNKKIDKLQNTVDKLAQSLYKHIKFIYSTYDGLKNPIEAARKWLRK